MKLFDRPGFVQGAIIAVSVLIVGAVIALSALGYLVFVDKTSGGPLQPATNTPTAKRAGPQPTDTPKIVWGTPTRMSHQMLNQAQDTAAQTTPTPILQATETATATATPPPSATDVPPAAGATPFAHPTYQPTTQPCAACHDNLRDFINRQ